MCVCVCFHTDLEVKRGHDLSRNIPKFKKESDPSKSELLIQKVDAIFY